MHRTLLLDNIRSLLNVGALFRTADGAGFDRVYLTGITPHPPRKEISKTALGAEEFVSWEYYRDPIEIIMTLRAQWVRIVALEQTPNSVSYLQLSQIEGDICLILGNEITGVDPEILALVDYTVEIPMLGQKQSLNVATAGGICMYEIVRAWLLN
jgi:23S rRNA (guanosine2251-2'-O)-methyltransferase